MPHGAGREQTRAREWTLSALIWSLVLLAAPFLSVAPAQALPWGLSAASLLGVTPPVLVAYLQKRNDLCRFGPSSLPPVVLGAAALGYIVQRLILWLDGPLALSAAVFALLAASVVLMLGNIFVSWSWLDVTSGAALVIIPVIVFRLFAVDVGLACGVTTGAVLTASVSVRCLKGSAAHYLSALGTGVVAVGGLFIWLLSVAAT